MQRLYRILLPRFRRRRMRLFSDLLRSTPTTTVLDVGGGPMNWQWCDPRPHVTVLNLGSGDVVADGRRLPFRDDSFDVVFSNSVIEHVGDGEDQAALAREITRVGRRYFVQTPNRNFPIEPHLLTPFVQFLPTGVRARIARNFTVWGLVTRPDPRAAGPWVRRIRLLTPGDMRRLFPEAVLHRERLLGITKSLVAVKGGVAP